MSESVGEWTLDGLDKAEMLGAEKWAVVRREWPCVRASTKPIRAYCQKCPSTPRLLDIRKLFILGPEILQNSFGFMKLDPSTALYCGSHLALIGWYLEKKQARCRSAPASLTARPVLD